MRAPDKWDSPRFQAVCVASGFFRFRTLSPLRPLAGNAGRWAADDDFESDKYVESGCRDSPRL